MSNPSPLDQLLAIMARLRDPVNGCPWDREQTFDSVAPYTIEEAHEVVEAIAARDYPHLREELGDLLLQVVFHARLAEEQAMFDFHDVVRTLNDKLIRRHPHVFGDVVAETAEDVRKTWAAIKAEEKAKAPAAGLLEGVGNGLPALRCAEKLQKQAGTVGFDWNDPHAVIAKLREELGEIEEALASNAGHEAVEEEVGDVLFCVVNLARHLRVDSELALARTNAKFRQRFGHIERTLAAEGRALADASLDEMEALWQAAKRL